jgi:arsenate reductase (thioredoxin)
MRRYIYVVYPFVLTVSDNAARELCPLWPGQPLAAQLLQAPVRGAAVSTGVPDPAPVTGPPEQIERAFRDTFHTHDRRISLFLCLSLASRSQLAMQNEIARLGQGQ